MNEHEKVGAIHKRQSNPWKKRLSWDEKIAQHFKAHGMPYVAKEMVDGHEVYIGVGDKQHDEPKEYPSGYYNAAFAVRRGKITPIQILHFDGNHDENMTEEGRLKGRVNTTIRAAKDAIQLGKEGGLYE